MNTAITTSRNQFPEFFKSWDTDPYQTFRGLFLQNKYDFPMEVWDGWHTPVGVMFNSLGIEEYWIPSMAHPENTEFYHQMDECISRFIKETPLTRETEFMWYLFLNGICLGPYFQADILKWVSENYRETDTYSLPSRIRYEILRCATGVASLLEDRVYMFRWVITRLMKSPYENRQLINWLFRSPEDGKIDSKILEFLPDMAMSHRRLLYREYQIHRTYARQHRKLRAGFFDRYKKRMEEQSSSFEWGIKEILFSIEYGYQKRAQRESHPEREAVFAAKANRFMIEHAARCPFPSV